jgi:hypothetical protein
MFWSTGYQAKLFQVGHAANPGRSMYAYPAIKDCPADRTKLYLIGKNNPKKFTVWR